MIIFDTNILSIFAKIDNLNLLLRISNEMLIVPEVKREIIVPLEYGKDWPDKILSISKTIYVNEEEQKLFEKFLSETRRLGRGELQAIVVCKVRGYIFCSFDRVAINFARKVGVKCMKLYDVFREFLKSEILNRKELINLMREIAEKDNIKFKNIEKNL